LLANTLIFVDHKLFSRERPASQSIIIESVADLAVYCIAIIGKQFIKLSFVLFAKAAAVDRRYSIA